MLASAFINLGGWEIFLVSFFLGFCAMAYRLPRLSRYGIVLRPWTTQKTITSLLLLGLGLAALSTALKILEYQAR